MKKEAIAKHRAGRRDEAEALYRQCLEKSPDDADVLYFLGLLCHETGRGREAVDYLKRALAGRPELAVAYAVLALALAATGQPGEALQAVEQALRRRPDDAVALNLAGELYRLRGAWSDAVGCYRHILAARPDHAKTHHHLAVSLYFLGHTREALAHFRRALESGPDDARLLYNYALALRAAQDSDGAREALERTLAVDPEHLGARCSLLQARLEVCDWRNLESACRYIAAGLERYLNEGGEEFLSPAAINYVPELAVYHDSLAAHHARHYSRMAMQVPTLPQKRPDSGESRIRIGYVSPDFGEHAVGILINDLFRHHEREKFEIYCYSLCSHDDSYYRRVQESADQFRELSEYSLEEAVGQIRDDGIDILVDLAGYTRNARPEIFAARAAPVQISYLGYLNTMAAEFIDYVIADPVVMPQDSEHEFTEAILHVPASFIMASPLETNPRVPDRAELLLPDGAFVFASFNNPLKIGPAVYGTWMRILEHVPGSVLWIFTKSSTDTEENLAREAKSHGISKDRIIFAGRVPLAEHLARARQADLFLDTFHYNAGTTAVCALASGLPVLTYTGDQMLSRLGTSLNISLGLEQLNCSSPTAYEKRAVQLASQPGELRRLRSQLLEAREQSGLFDPARFARQLEMLYHQVWERHRKGEPPVSLYL
ncbi:MAG: tetratricopeptide repeat protein [Gammaproteobacteria bacterium]|nr:tetratricopeptide repeat protein [Gammaproteobacteria bacterium]MCZ6716694.1 tetratricopeptide repeat protein [Gammaproteobacteria bacterium]MCZ6826898.1 tetratricopeptide repeat protein [Gammaproteobacteria bacterium]MCZ6881181.1 tetratricopeptide repeat protein [Gammaproteobacteria bacterium]